MPDFVTIAAALAWARAARGQASDPSLEAEALLAHHVRVPRAWLLAHPEAALDRAAAEPFARDVGRLAAGEPLPYLTGVQEFFGLAFAVSPDVLIPRPETELLVEEARLWLAHRAQAGGRRVIDVGTGSGCIAVSLAVSAPAIPIVATDLSAVALAVAQGNARRFEVADRMRFIRADLLSPFAQGFDLVCANLPYIPSEKLLALDVARHEPRLALDGGRDGLDPTRRLLAQARTRLNSGGCMLLEIEESHGQAARELARQVFPTARLSMHADLAGRDRLLRIDLE
jgi:release factor glutamine methyltransferase